MSDRKIVLMCSEDLIAPFQKEGFDVFWTLSLVYGLFYQGKSTILLSLEEFKKRLDSYKNEILQFNPTYFLADSGFFASALGRLEKISKPEAVELWISFVKALNERGIITIVSCVDDPWAYVVGKEHVRRIRDVFKIVKTHSMQLAAEYEKKRQKVIYFPNYANICFEKPAQGKEDPLLKDKIDSSVFDFDLFFVGRMDWARRQFFWRLSRKAKTLDYFFGSKDVYYTSRKRIDFDPQNRYHLQEIYKRTSINIVYGSMNEFLFNKTWGITDRVFNIAYCHGFLLCDYRRHLEDLFDIDPKLYTFKTLGECDRKIK